MNKSFVILWILFALVTILPAQTITLLTYNIRMDTPSDSLNAWQHRKDFLLNQVSFYSPDVIGTQEGFKHQLDYLDAGLENYTYEGIGRDDGKTMGEYTAIFYNKKKFNLLESGNFWLSQTPDRVGLGWDAVCNRTCTYLLLENKTTHQNFWVFNTHFDHKGIIARTNAASLILEKMEALNKENHPSILMGDFNVEPTDPVYSLLTKNLADAKSISRQAPFGNEGTFNGFKFQEILTRRIDYIFVKEDRVAVLKYAVLSDSKNCRYPSDHLPVFAEVLIKE